MIRLICVCVCVCVCERAVYVANLGGISPHHSNAPWYHQELAGLKLEENKVT